MRPHRKRWYGINGVEETIVDWELLLWSLTEDRGEMLFVGNLPARFPLREKRAMESFIGDQLVISQGIRLDIEGGSLLAGYARVPLRTFRL